MGTKGKNKPRTFEEIYSATRREWPVGIKPYTRIFKDGRKVEEKKNRQLIEEEYKEMSIEAFPFSETLRAYGYSDEEILEIIRA